MHSLCVLISLLLLCVATLGAGADPADPAASTPGPRHRLTSPALRPGDAPRDCELPHAHTLDIPLVGLARGAAYELRVNWPAVGPGKFTVWVDDLEDSDGGPRGSGSSGSGDGGGGGGGGKQDEVRRQRRQRRRRRRLLDADKFVFRAPAVTQDAGSLGFGHGEAGVEGENDGTVSLWGHVRVDKEGVSWDPDVENRPVRFNLLVERVYWGVLPARTARLIAFLACALGLALGCGVPLAQRVLFRELGVPRRNAD